MTFINCGNKTHYLLSAATKETSALLQCCVHPSVMSPHPSTATGTVLAMQVPSGSVMTIPHPEVRPHPPVVVSCLNPAHTLQSQGGSFQLHLCSSGPPINVLALNQEQQTAQELLRTHSSQAPGAGGVAEGCVVLSSEPAEDGGDLSMDIMAMIESATAAKLVKSLGEGTCE